MTEEDKLQIEVAKWLDENLHETIIWYHVANERKAKPQYHAKQKRKGVKAGVPDIVINWRVPHTNKNTEERTIYIELKKPVTYKISEKTGKKIVDSPAGTLSQAQLAFYHKADHNMIQYYVCYTLDEVIKVLHGRNSCCLKSFHNGEMFK